MNSKNAFHWQGGSSFATAPENYQFQTKKFKQWNVDRKERPDTTPDWETYRTKTDIQYKHYATKAEKALTALMSPKEQAFNRKMRMLAVRAARKTSKPDHFNVPIMSRKESDRTQAIKGHSL